MKKLVNQVKHRVSQIDDRVVELINLSRTTSNDFDIDTFIKACDAIYKANNLIVQLFETEEQNYEKKTEEPSSPGKRAAGKPSAAVSTGSRRSRNRSRA